ncbi:hypothetical protein PR048_012454 [Dryococelus australis]|uniref:Uncharacterized protein n=1 Tax=Dryococelus australis TaxID=614101 RepID=A0ABQ9HPF1_9NEOP|nr:hypothetical protein PR048_012454 [Dryococelus australis]
MFAAYLSGQDTTLRSPIPCWWGFQIAELTPVTVYTNEHLATSQPHSNSTARTTAGQAAATRMTSVLLTKTLNSHEAFFSDAITSNKLKVRRLKFINVTNYTRQPCSTFGATVAKRLAHLPPTKANQVQSLAGSLDFRKWESCRMMPLVGWFSLGPPVSPTPSFQHRSIFTSITLIGSQDFPRRNERAEVTGDPWENPPTSGIFRLDSHMRNPLPYLCSSEPYPPHPFSPANTVYPTLYSSQGEEQIKAVNSSQHPQAADIPKAILRKKERDQAQQQCLWGGTTLRLICTPAYLGMMLVLSSAQGGGVYYPKHPHSPDEGGLAEYMPVCSQETPVDLLSSSPAACSYT